MADTPVDAVMQKLDAAKDAMTVRRVFGDSYQVDGATVIPVAVVKGGGGGGGGEGRGPDQQGSGTGAGMGFGVNVRPLGVYVVKDGDVRWQPAVDVMRIILGGQILGLVAILTVRRILSRR
jgi:uncharacterized spore protein YtfJ